MSDEKKGSLSAADQSLLAQIHERFLKSRLAQIPGVSLMGVLVGKLLAAAERRGLNWRAVVVANLPTNILVARKSWGLTRRDEAAIRFSQEHAAEYVTDMAERMKEAIGETVTGALTEKLAPQETARLLRDEYGAMNRDWRRMALTETAIAVSNGYLAQQAVGTYVVGDTAVDCCDWCREHLQGRAFRLIEPVTEPTAEESETCVWVGKTNVGRSRYALRKDGTYREHAEQWHPCIPAHPHCRCRWRRYDPDLEAIKPGTNEVVDRFNVWEKH